jgi:hypothetical protein
MAVDSLRTHLIEELADLLDAEARMIGVEYIISEKLYTTLPAEEKAYWHPAQLRDPVGTAPDAGPAGCG